jgi:3-hydroxybutyryl-CoA dehydrogenase
MARECRTIGVVGLGTMGAGIVEVFARNGLDVVAVEADQAGLERGRGHLEQSTGRAVARGKMSADQQTELLGRVTFATDLEAMAPCDLVVEAVPEHLDL